MDNKNKTLDEVMNDIDRDDQVEEVAKRGRGRPTKEESEKIFQEKFGLTKEEEAKGELDMSVPDNFDLEKNTRKILAKHVIQTAKRGGLLSKDEAYLILQIYNSTKKADSKEPVKKDLYRKEVESLDNDELMNVLRTAKDLGKNKVPQ